VWREAPGVVTWQGAWLACLILVLVGLLAVEVCNRAMMTASLLPELAHISA
jgi:hypothetical protein